MNKLNVAEFVSSLTKDEFGAFGSYLSSEYFGFPKRLEKVYYIFKEKFFSEGEFDKTEHLSREELGKIIYGKLDSKTDANVRKLLSEFNAALEKFFIQYEFENEPARHKMLLMRYHNKRGNSIKLEAIFRESQKYLNSNARRDEFYYEALEGMYKELFLSRRANDIVENEESLQQFTGYLDLAYAENKLYSYLLLFSKQYVNRNKLNYEWTFYDEIMNWVEKNLIVIKEEHPEIYIKYNEIRFHLDPSKSGIIDESINYIFDRIQYTHLDLTIYFEDLINLCNQRITGGDSSYEGYIIKMAKVLDERDLFGRSLKLNYVLYKSIIEASIDIDIEWGEYFAQKYSHHLNPEFRTSAPNLMLAKLNLFKKDYEKARRFESKIDYKDFIHFTDGKGILARLEYETENYAESLMAIETLRKYLASNENIPAFWSLFYKNFSECLRKLIRIKESFEINEKGFELLKLEDEVKSLKGSIYAIEWLLSKIEDLK